MNPSTLKGLQTNPELFLTEVLGVQRLETYHKTILKDVAQYSRVAIAACHAVGKTWLMARVALWFLFNHKGAKVITTAPTNLQVEMLLWGEIWDAVANSKYALGGHLTSKKLEVEKGSWYALGFSPEKKAASETGEQAGSSFQGWHSDYILIIMDEAVGVPPDIWKQVEGLLTSGKIVKFLTIANPTTKNCEFYQCFKKANWKKVYLSCFDSPNLIANNITCLDDIIREVDRLRILPEDERLRELERYKKPVTHLLSVQWVIEQALDWGIDSPLFQSKVLGKFPDIDDSTLIQISDVEAAQARNHNFDLGWNDSKNNGKRDLRVVGVDVARFGEDLTVFTEIFGSVHTDTVIHAKRDLMAICGYLTRFLLDNDDGRTTNVPIDATGLGSGVYDRMVELRKEKTIPKNFKFIEIHFSNTVEQLYKLKHGKNKAKWGPKTKKEFDKDNASFANLKSKMFVDLGQDLRNELRLMPDKDYMNELPTINYDFTSNGKMKIESKKDYKKRTSHKSPDKSDSLAIANLGRKIKAPIDNLKGLLNL